MKANTGYVFDERYLRHDPGTWHPERPDRLRAIHRRVRQSGLINELTLIEPYEAPLEWITRLHDPDYVEHFRQACEKNYTIFQAPDNGICSESYDIARLSVGGVLAACDAMMHGIVTNAFCAVRPPGHHAEHAQAMGFCFFNNIAIGARYLQEKYGLERIAIIDWDVHHGNGTQHLFEEDPTVFYISLHEEPEHCYPGTGHKTEKGRGAGLGYTLNFPFPPRSGDWEYLEVIEEEVIPALDAFKPDCLMISAGFDAHRNDPLAHMKLSRAGYSRMGRALALFAKEYCQFRLITVLEGGYNLEVLEDCVEDHLNILQSIFDPDYPRQTI
jgi:acetoin utilization deacetylase AcuC-like enzyme